MMRGGKVRFEEAPHIQVEESSNQLLMDALQIDDSSSISDTRIEASFMSEGNVNRYNFVGRTPHAKVIEAEESRKRLKELTKMMAMPPLSQTPVRISVPISEISPQSDISMSPAVMNHSQHSSVASTPAENNLIANAEEDGRISPIQGESVRSKGIAMDTSTRGIAMDSSTPVIDRSQQSLPTPNSTGSQFSSDSSFNIVESLGCGTENKEPSTAGFTVSAPAAAPSEPSVMNTPSTILGSAPASSAKRNTKEARTPFSDISNRSAPALNQRDGDDGYDVSAQKTLINKSVSFHRSHVESSAKPKKSKAPVTPYAKIECSESEDGESDVDCNAIVVSQMQCPSPTVQLMHQEPSIVEKQLFMNSTEKQKPGPGGSVVTSPSNESVASLKSSASATSVGIAELPVQRKTKEDSRNWHGGLDIAKETMPTEIIQTQYIIVPAPRPEMHDVATTYSPMMVTVPPSPAVHNAANVPVPVMVSFSPVPSVSVACSPIVMQPTPAHVAEVETAPKLAVHVPNAAPQRSSGLPPMPPSAPVVNTSTVAPPTYMQPRVELETSIMSTASAATTTATASMIISHSRMGRPIANDFEYGVSFGKGPTASCVQAKKVEIKHQGLKKADTIVSPVESKLLVEVEKPVVSACTADLHPAKAFYSPNNTRKVQDMLGDVKPHKGLMHDRTQVVTRAEHPSNVSGLNASVQHVQKATEVSRSVINHSMNMSHVSHSEPPMATVDVSKVHVHDVMEEEEKVMYVTQAAVSPSKTSMVSTSTLSEYQQDLSSIRAMDVSIQVDSAMFSQVKKELSAVVAAVEVSSKELSTSTTSRSMVNTPGSSVQTDPMSQSVLLKSATKSSSSGAFNESMMSHSSSYYYAASGENDETGDETERSFALADLLPPTATKTGLGKGLFPAESTFMKQQPSTIVPTSLSNPWIYRVGFDSRLCNVGSITATSTATKTSPLMMSSASHNSLFVGTGSLGKPQRLTIVGPDADKKQQLIDQWNESYYQDDDVENDDDEDFDGGAKSSRDVMFKEELEQRFAASKGTASTVTVDRTAAFHRSNLLDLTMRSDVAVANYTRQSMTSATAMDDSYMTSGADTTFTLDQSYMTKTTLMSHEEVIPRFAIKSLKRSSDETFEVKEMNFETAPGEYTTVMMVFDNNRPHPVTLKAQTALVRVEPMMSTRMDMETWDAVAEEFLANVQQNEKSDEFFTVSPGEVTIPPYKEGSLFITFAPAAGIEGIYSGAMRIKQDRKAYTILLRGESAMRHSVHSTPAALTASATMPSSPAVIPEHVVIGASTAVDVSQFPNHSHLSWSKVSTSAPTPAPTATVATTAVATGVTDEPALAKNMSTILLSASSIAEESALFSSTQLAPVPPAISAATAGTAISTTVSPAKSMGSVSPASTMFQDRLRALHERIAALSCKVLWKHVPSPTAAASPSESAAAGQASPAASETTIMGLQVQPEFLRIDDGMEEYHTLRLINPEMHRTMMVKLMSSHRCVRVSTTMVSINPDAEARVLVKLDRHVLVEQYGEAMMKAASTGGAATALDNWCCGALTLQYDADLEVTVSVVLSADMVQEVVRLYQQQQVAATAAAAAVAPTASGATPSVMSTPATTAQRQVMSNSAPASAVKTTSSRKLHQQQQQVSSSSAQRRVAHPATPMSMNASDYHHQLQYVDDASASFDAVHSFLPSAVKRVKSQKSYSGAQASKTKQGTASYQKPPLATHPSHPPASVSKAIVSDNVSVASTISSHPMSTQPQQRVRQGSITSQMTASSSATAVSSSSSMRAVTTNTSVAMTHPQQGHSMLSVPDLSLVSTTSSLMRGPATAPTVAVSQAPVASSSSAVATAVGTVAAAPSERTHLLIGKRRGLFFENVTAMFGSVMVGCLVRTRVILANASNEEAVVYLGDLDCPFLITKNEVRLKPRSYVRVPVQFLPTKPGHYQAELMAQSADGQHTTSIKLSGHCYV